MDRDLFSSLAQISLAIVGVGALAVLVSKNSQTGSVLGAYGNMFSTMLGSAEAPVTNANASGYNDDYSFA